MCWIQYGFGIRTPMANWMIEPRSIQSQWFPMLAPLTTTPPQHMCMLDKNQLLKSCIKVRYCFWCVCHKPRDVATPEIQVHNFIYRLLISPNFKFLALMVSEFLLNLAFNKWCFGLMFGTPRQCKKVCLLNICWYPNKFSVLVQAVQNN